MSAVITKVVESLVVRHELTRRVGLEELAEAAAEASLGYDEIEAVVEELEARGYEVGGEPSANELALLGEVLAATRTAMLATGRRPSVEELSETLGKPAFVIRRLLEEAGRFGAGGAARGGAQGR